VVESVAWISEIKNTLSLPLFLGAMCAWIDYDTRGKRNDYFWTLGLFLAAMLCKTTVVMFPVVILLYAWWKRGRVGWDDLKASAPFFMISLGLGLVTIWFLRHHAIGEVIIPVGGFFPRLALAGLSLAFYFSKCDWPAGLMTIYPKWAIDPPSLIQFLPWPILGGIVGWLWLNRATWGRHVLLGFGFFVVNLTPFIGFITGSYMNFTWVMDHLLYLPVIGLIGLAVAGLGQLAEQIPSPIRCVGIGIMVIAIIFLARESHAYAGLYRSSQKLWTYTVERNPEAWLARNNLGTAFFKAGQFPEAIDQYEQALKINPQGLLAHNNLGEALARVNRVPEAIAQFEAALKANPDDAEAHCNLGVAWAKSGRTSEAIEQFKTAEKIQPENVETLYNLGIALLEIHQPAEAVKRFEQILKTNPDDADIHDKMGDALSEAGRTVEAVEHYRLSLKFNSEDGAVRNKLARLQGLPQTAPSPEPSAK